MNWSLRRGYIRIDCPVEGEKFGTHCKCCPRFRCGLFLMLFCVLYSFNTKPNHPPRKQRVRRLLRALINIFRLCPRSKSDLQREMTTNFPHYKTAPLALYTWYAHMCLQIVHLVPTFEGPILTLFVDKALDMDVEIKVNDRGFVMLDSTPRNGEDDHDDELGGKEGKDEEEFDGVKQELFKNQEQKRLSMKLTSSSKKRSFQQLSSSQTSLVNNNSTTPNNKSNDADSTNRKESDSILEISERLDTLMTLFYQRIIHVTSFEPDSLSSAIGAVFGARRLYRHLDEVFDKKVRTTDRSKFVQFAFLVLFGRENDALGEVARLMAKKEDEQQKQQHKLDTTKDIVQQTMKDNMDMEPDLISPASSINVMDPLYRGFSAKLIDLFYNPSYAGDVPRQTVVCYLASFVSRASYVCPETVCECLAALLRWAEAYIEAQSVCANTRSTPVRGHVRRISSSMSLGSKRDNCETHALFYTACQAAFYIMCFRGAEALTYYRKAFLHKDDPDSQYAHPENVDISAHRWKSLCDHELQPLKHCLESVRLEFLHLAEDLDLFHNDRDSSEDDNTVNENEQGKREETIKFLRRLWSTSSSSKQDKQLPHGLNKSNKTTATPKRRRSIVISTAATQEKKRLDGGVGGLGRGSNPLNSFFPFDPYLLQKSYGYVHPYYRNWEDCILTIEEESTETNKDEEEAVDFNEEESSDVSDPDDDDEEVLAAEEEEDSDEEEDDNEDDESNITKEVNPNLQVGESLEMEIRRSRAMSTGSQCSW